MIVGVCLKEEVVIVGVCLKEEVVFVGLEWCLKKEVVFVKRGVGYSLYCDCPKSSVEVPFVGVLCGQASGLEILRVSKAGM